MSLFRKRGTKFPEQNSAVLGLFFLLSEPSRSVQETKWLIGQGGRLSGKMFFRLRLPVMGGQSYHEEAFSIQKTVVGTVSGGMNSAPSDGQ